MPSESIRLRLKLGHLEVDYEGHPEFIQDELPVLLERASQLSLAIAKSPTSSLSGSTTDTVSPVRETPETNWSGHTTSSIASLLSIKTGPELIIAAAAKLTFVDQSELFSRQEILAEMKTAASYYKASYHNNLTKYLQGLEGADRLRSGKKDTYALSPSEGSKLDARIAQRK